MITVACDGGSRGNPGPAAYGYIVKVGNQVLKKGKGYIGETTNNVAEYTAIFEALKWLRVNHKGENLEFFLDSKLAASQLSGFYKVKNAKIRELIFSIREIEPDFGNIGYNHVPREENKEADKLVNEALDNHGI